MFRYPSFRRLSGGSHRPPPSPGLDTLDFKRYAYVDKTLLLARILTDDPWHSAGKYLHAPAMRCMGKSTAVKMLASMARGEKEMFEGMAVCNPGTPLEIGQIPLSVIQLDFSSPSIEPTMNLDQVEASIAFRMQGIARQQHGIEISSSSLTPGDILVEWIQKLKILEGNPIVLIIDEYDAPVNVFLPSDPQKAEGVAGVLKPFYQAVKAYGENFHKVFVTGTSKLCLNSMSSGSNQFLRIMEDTAEFSSLYGFTDREIRLTYGKYIETKFEQPLDEVMVDLKYMYNGYWIHPDQEPSNTVYNPWSVLNYLDTGKLVGYWAKSAGTSPIMSMLGTNAMNIVKGYEIKEDELFANISTAEHNRFWRQLAFHSGYSTIKSVERSGSRKKKLILGCPNKEIEDWLSGGTIEYITSVVEESLLLSYKTNLLGGNIREAEKNMVKIIQSQVHKPANETEFGCYALFPLIGGDPVCIDLVFESRVRLDHEPVERGDYSAFDGAVLYREGEIIVMAVLEMKFSWNINGMSALNQIGVKRYSERARKLLEERNNVTIEKIVRFGITLFISPSVQVKVAIQSEG